MEEDVHIIEKSESEEIRISTRTYMGREYIDLRVFYRPEDRDCMVPTKKGITVSFPQLFKIIKKLNTIVAVRKKPS